VLDRRLGGVDSERIHGCLKFFLTTRVGVLRARAGESKVSFWVRQNEAFCTAVARLDWGSADTVYAFNGAALEIFQRASARGIRCILDQTAAPWRFNTRILLTEQTRWPGWETSPIDIDPDDHMTAREESEWKLADRIICGSPFVVDAIRAVGGPVEKCQLVPYPLPDPPAPRPAKVVSHDAPIRVLFVGTLQLRKGIQYLYDVAARLNGHDFEFRAVGPSNLTPQAESWVRSHIDWRGRVGINDVWTHYHWADVFLLPTLSEGSANVCWEAATAGTQVITTAAAGSVAPHTTIVPLEPHAIVTQLQGRARARRQHTEVAFPPRSVAEYGVDLVCSMS